MRLLIGFTRRKTAGIVFALGTLAALGGELDLKYLYFWDRNGVWNHTPALRWAGSPYPNLSLRWEQEADFVSGASRRLGMRRIGTLGDHDLLLDGITGASKSEFRHAEKVKAGWRAGLAEYGGSYAFADEEDYTSHGFGLSAKRDCNGRNTTLSGDIGFMADDFHPLGAFAGTGGSKTIKSVSLGLLQTLTPYSLAGTTIRYIRNEGYLGHPYLPVITESGSMILERVPDLRNSLAATATFIQGYRYAGRLGSIHLEAGAYADDWGLLSQSGEAQWYQYLRGSLALRLRARAYRQEPAAFARERYTGREAYRVSDIRYYGFSSLSGGVRLSGGFPGSLPEWMPDRWDAGYDQGIRDTRGEEGTGAAFAHYQLFPSTRYYQEGSFMAGLGFDW